METHCSRCKKLSVQRISFLRPKNRGGSLTGSGQKGFLQSAVLICSPYRRVLFLILLCASPREEFKCPALHSAQVVQEQMTIGGQLIFDVLTSLSASEDLVNQWKTEEQDTKNLVDE